MSNKEKEALQLALKDMKKAGLPVDIFKPQLISLKKIKIKSQS